MMHVISRYHCIRFYKIVVVHRRVPVGLVDYLLSDSKYEKNQETSEGGQWNSFACFHFPNESELRPELDQVTLCKRSPLAQKHQFLKSS